MSNYFISYSHRDGLDFALNIYSIVKNKTPSSAVWFDKHIQGGEPWQEAIDNAIRRCETLIFIMTQESVQFGSGCEWEYLLARDLSKFIIPLKFHENIETPLTLRNLQYIDFVTSESSATEALVKQLQWLESNEGRIWKYQQQIMNVRRKLETLSLATTEKVNLEHKLEKLQALITSLEDNNTNEKQDSHQLQSTQQASIGSSYDFSRNSTTIINSLPSKVPPYFKGRKSQIYESLVLLNEEYYKFIYFIGRGGIGKTTLVGKILETIINREKIDRFPLLLNLDTIINIRKEGHAIPNIDDILLSLAQASNFNNQEINRIINNSSLQLHQKVELIVSDIGKKFIIIFFDNFEDYINTSRKVDEDIDEFLRVLLRMHEYNIKVIFTTRELPEDLPKYMLEYQRAIFLDGLNSDAVKDIFAELDRSGVAGLNNIEKEKFDKILKRTLGYPRAIITLYALLSMNKNNIVEDFVSDVRILPDEVISVLIGEAFDSLANLPQMILMSLAVYNTPVYSRAIEHMLFPFTTEQLDATLEYLVNMQLVVRFPGDRFALISVDQQFIFDRIPLDNNKHFNRTILAKHGAEYYSINHIPIDHITELHELDSYLNEYNLLLLAEDFQHAFTLLSKLDDEVLSNWGKYQAITRMHNRLRSYLEQPNDKELSHGITANSYRRLGNHTLALEHYQDALSIAKQHNNLDSMCRWMGRLGGIYRDIGDFDTALKYHSKALSIAVQIEDIKKINFNTAEIGTCYSSIGKTEQAIEQYTKTKLSNTEMVNDFNLASDLRDLGRCYTQLGKIEQAIEAFQEALQISIDTKHERGQSVALCGLGYAYIDKSDFLTSLELCQEALDIADRINLLKVQNEANWIIAMARLSMTNIEDAFTSIQQAHMYFRPTNMHNIYTFEGIIELARNNVGNANQSFFQSIKHSQNLLKLTRNNFDALNSQAIANAVLSCLSSSSGENYMDKAVDIYKESLNVCSDPGVKRYFWHNCSLLPNKIYEKVKIKLLS